MKTAWIIVLLSGTVLFKSEGFTLSSDDDFKDHTVDWMRVEDEGHNEVVGPPLQPGTKPGRSIATFEANRRLNLKDARSHIKRRLDNMRRLGLRLLSRDNARPPRPGRFLSRDDARPPKPG
eukprot:gene15304-6519_t